MSPGTHALTVRSVATLGDAPGRIRKSNTYRAKFSIDPSQNVSVLSPTNPPLIGTPTDNIVVLGRRIAHTIDFMEPSLA